MHVFLHFHFSFRIFWFHQVGSLQHKKGLLRSSSCSKPGRRLDVDQTIGIDRSTCSEHGRELATTEHQRQAVLQNLSTSKARSFMHRARAHDAHRCQPHLIRIAHRPSCHGLKG